MMYTKRSLSKGWKTIVPLVISFLGIPQSNNQANVEAMNLSLRKAIPLQIQPQIEKKEVLMLDDILSQGDAMADEVRTIVAEVENAQKNDWANEILATIDYHNGPSMYAGQLKSSKEVKIIKKEGNAITEAIGVASLYVRRNGSMTATGDNYQRESLTIAINERLGIPVPSKWGIRRLDNGLYVEVVANNYGPYLLDKKGNLVTVDGREVPHPKRLIDVTPYVAKVLHLDEKQGLAKVQITYLGDFSKKTARLQ